MMMQWLRTALLLLIVAGCSAPQDESLAPRYSLEQVVVVRHGVRTQTDSVMLAHETGHSWPLGNVPDGELTPNGALGTATQMRWLLSQWRQAGLRLDEGCPAPQILAWSSRSMRTRATGEAVLDAMFPGCGLQPQFSRWSRDPVMKGHKAAVTPLDHDKVLAQVAALAGLGMAEAARRYQPDVERLQAAVCQPDACAFMAQPWSAEIKKGRVRFTGPLQHAANMGETIRMQYSEGLPLDQVAFGHVHDAADVNALLALHAARFALGNDIPEVARHDGSALMSLLHQALATRQRSAGTPLGRPLVLFFGHDTNISQIRTLLGFEWTLPGYPHNDIPPGGALVFERYHDRDQDRGMVRVSFQARSLDQWRQLATPDQQSPLLHSDWQFPGCESTSLGVLCPWEEVSQRMLQAVDPRLKAPEDYFATSITP